MKDLFLIVDGNSLMHRAFHALPLMDADGVFTNAIYGFLSMLLKVIREENAQYLAICFDEHGPTFRHTVYADYKAGRNETPPELRQQFVTIMDVLDAMGIRRFSLAGWEADDLLGTLSLKGGEAGVTPLLLTGDRDALQLVGGPTELLFTRKGISETIRFTPEKVFEEYGFGPGQVTDWKGLAGDSSDNIPGVPGVGDKTAVKLLAEYKTLENVLAHASEVKGKLGEKLTAWADQARFCKELATIRRDAPVDFRLIDCALPDLKQGIPMLQKLKLQSIIRRLGAEDAPEGAAAEADHEENIQMPEFAAAEQLFSEDEVSAWLAALRDEDLPLAVYAEETAISLAAGSGRFALITLGGDLLNPGMDPGEVLRVLAPYISRRPAAVHDGKSLLHALKKADAELPEAFEWDTMLGAYLLDPQQKSYRLQALAPDEPADARAVYRLYLRQQSRVRREGMEKLMLEVELPLSGVLFRMEDCGFRVDTAFLRELGDRYIKETARLKDEIFAACGTPPFNLNSTQQLGEVLFDKLGLPHGKKTSKGYSTSAEVLEGLRYTAPDVIEPLLRYRQLTKLNGTYVEGVLPLTDRAGRVHSWFDQTSTATGRLSSSEPNLQNIPVRTEEGREIRRAFVPEDGWVLVDADYSQIELRLMAHFSGDPAMTDAFMKGQDVHARTASEIFDVAPENVTPELRSRAKAVNFGLIYGISGFGLSRNTGVTRKEAAEFIDRYFEKYPGAKRFMDDACEAGIKNGYAVTLMGRRRYLPELKDTKATVREFGKRAAMNTPIQGTAADIIKLAMVRVDRALRENNMRSRLILQVHDELILECPPEEAGKAAELLKAAMEGAIALKVPLEAEIHTGATWAEAK
ncbi:MAG: DNA polymerase I [Clostridia bacterium]|nr:DNA polymerase I [Clostridia bacterium]